MSIDPQAHVLLSIVSGAHPAWQLMSDNLQIKNYVIATVYKPVRTETEKIQGWIDCCCSLCWKS